MKVGRKYALLIILSLTWSLALYGYDLYFTPQDGVKAEARLAELIRGAQSEVKMAIYSLENTPLIPALIEAKNRKIKVEVVVDGEHKDQLAVQLLKESNIAVEVESGGGLMHNKFIVVDQNLVVTGSANFTPTSFTKDHNNIFIFKSPEIAKFFSEEFDEMFKGKIFGGGRPLKYHLYPAEDIKLEIYFAPEDEVEKNVMLLLAQAKQSVELAAYTCTADWIGKALVIHHTRGLKVRAIFEREQISPYSEFLLLAPLGVPCWPDNEPALMHHKFIIIDHKIVLTGSFNYTKAADTKNDENMIVIHSEAIATKYLQEFDQLWGRYQVKIDELFKK